MIGGKRFFGLDTMGLVPRVNAIKAALGLPESVVGALPIVGAAWLAMGFPTDNGYSDTSRHLIEKPLVRR